MIPRWTHRIRLLIYFAILILLLYIGASDLLDCEHSVSSRAVTNVEADVAVCLCEVALVCVQDDCFVFVVDCLDLTCKGVDCQVHPGLLCVYHVRCLIG